MEATAPSEEKPTSSFNLDEFQKIKLKALDLVSEKALKSEQYMFMIDKTGNANVYFNYKATMREFFKELVAVQMQK